MADTYDIMKEVARSVLREELNLEVVRDSKGVIVGDEYYFKVQLKLGDELIGEPIHITLSHHWDRDDCIYDLEVSKEV